MKLIVSTALLNLLPAFNPVAYEIRLNGKIKKDAFYEDFKNYLASFSTYQLESVVGDALIKETRDAYKALKKDPSHTRPACEALLRQAIRGQINFHAPLVDLGNYLSLLIKRSVYLGKKEAIVGDIKITIGKAEDSFLGLGNRNINAENLIIYKDDLGVIGSPTSDTYRTSVDEEDVDLVLMIMNFNQETLEEEEHILNKLFNLFFEDVEIRKITKEEGSNL